MNNQIENMPDKMVSLCKEAKRMEEDALYSSKGHFNDEEFWISYHYYLGILATIFAALSGSSLFYECPKIASIFALLASLLSGLITFLNPNEKAVEHRKAGSRFLALRKDIGIFHKVVIYQTEDFNELLKQLEKFSSIGAQLNDDSPPISGRAYRKAQDGIENGEASYKIDN
jgi:hypothetical protein